MKKMPSLLLALAIGTVMSGCAMQPSHGEVRVHSRDYDVRVVFSDHDRALIRDYYRIDYRALPPGLAKQGKFPPGHAKRLMRGQPVPPGLEWRYLPERLESRLTRLPDGYVRIIIGADVAIMHVHTRVIMDVIEDLGD